MSTKYSRFARNEYSQFGEDGIVERVLEDLSERDEWCVEFGAWDGMYLSNTFNLIKNKGYSSVLIEADSDKFIDLQKNMSSFNTRLVNKFVEFEGENTLDKILADTDITRNFDFLSIDIDGNDYWIFESLNMYRPKVICIEYNPTIPNELEYVQPRDVSINRGASALSICNLAKQKSYELVALTSHNLILVDAAYADHFELGDSSLAELRDDSSIKNYVFVGYDGTVIYSKDIHFNWHDFSVTPEAHQVLPRFLRTFPPNFSLVQKTIFAVFLLFKEPARTIERIKLKLKGASARRAN